LNVEHWEFGVRLSAARVSLATLLGERGLPLQTEAGLPSRSLESFWGWFAERAAES
jgi:hypothetical protein